MRIYQVERIPCDDPIGDGKLFIASKSTNEGDFAGYIRDVLDKTLTTAQQAEFAEYLRKNNCTAVFECIDPIHDPHIVEYTHAHLVLLDLCIMILTTAMQSITL